MLLVIGVSLVLASGTYVLIPDSFERTLHDGHSSTTGAGSYSVLFPGRSNSWKLDIDIGIEGMPIDFVVNMFHLTWEDYENSEAPEWGVLYEAFNVTEINEILMLCMRDHVGIFVLIRGVDSGMYSMRGHIIASCDYYPRAIPLALREGFLALTFVVSAVFAVDLIGNWIKERKEQG